MDNEIILLKPKSLRLGSMNLASPWYNLQKEQIDTSDYSFCPVLIKQDLPQ